MINLLSKTNDSIKSGKIKNLCNKTDDFMKIDKFA